MSGLTDATGFVADNVTGMMRPGTDRNVIVMFTKEAIQNAAKSEAEGRPIFDAIDYVRIQHPGERDFDKRPAREEDRMRWPHQWQAYQNNAGQAPNGTPLDILFPGNPEIVAMLKTLQVLTVEHLAEAGEVALTRIGFGARDWQAKAKTFMDMAKTAAPLHAAQKMIETQKERIENLEQQLAVLASKMARFDDGDDDQPRRGRPRRAE